MTEKHVHVYERKSGAAFAHCTVCGRQERVENLVYLGDAPRSVGLGSAWR
jgi:hypothetical protein